MILGAQEMACGACGHGTFRLFTGQPGRAMLVAECQKCKGTTIIKPADPKPALEFDWGEGEGILTTMKPSSF